MNYQKQTNNRNYDQKQPDNQRKYNESKNDIIDYIYQVVDLSQYRYDVIRYEGHLSKFLANKYYVSPNYYGKNCFLVFTKLKNKYYSFMIDRKQLSYTRDKVNANDVFIFHCNAEVDMSIYSGTIFDGNYVKNGNSHEFIITDVYMFKGANYAHINLEHKLYEIELYLDNINIATNKEHFNDKINLSLSINKIYNLVNIRDFVENQIPIIEKTHQTKGLTFYPEFSGVKLLFLPENEQTLQNNPVNQHINQTIKHDNNIVKQTNDNNQYNQTKSNIKKYFTSKTNEPVYAILEMKTTRTVDNYKMFAVEQINVDGVTKLKKYQMDIAHVPNIDKSKWCQKITTESPTGCVFVKCLWIDDKNKWEPMEVVTNVKLPSLMCDIRKNIVEFEQSDDESIE